MFDTSPQGISKLIVGGESEHVEFKTRLTSDDFVARVISAFANTDGGILLVGVGEQGVLVGIPEEEVELVKNRLGRIASSLLSWSSENGVVNVAGKSVVFLIVEKGPESFGPILTSRGSAYIRQHTMIRPAELRKITGEILPTRQISAQETLKKVNVFVAMSFRDEEEPALVDYFRAMQRAVTATKLPIELVRIDLAEGDYEISQEIMERIDQCDFVITDFTLNARNVYFELGYARGKHRRIIQTARKGTNLEFDVRNWRTIFYRNSTELEEKLVPALEAAYDYVMIRTS